MLTIPRGESPHRGQLRTHAVCAWRDAAALVWTRWEEFLTAPSEARSFAYAAYVAALDAEAAAAGDLAGIQLSLAA